MAEWSSVHQPKPRQERTDQPQKWEAPEDGWVKINSDDAVNKGGSKAGGGAVLPDHNGAFLAGVCHHFPHIVEPEAAEILACKRALQVAEEINVQNVHLELDCLPVVQMINQEGINYSGAGPWIQEIKQMLVLKNDYKVTWVKRTGNVAAHKLAKVGVGDELCKVWLGVPPDCILDVISDDIPSYTSLNKSGNLFPKKKTVHVFEHMGTVVVEHNGAVMWA
ncbi:uncharacterized protein [Aegilops tauschii subsp. strangulata]|uniref:uncharacterized protein n=1 Tax=Aegilops tauschii subsp. strangulata TaxID=200361 RepID=UPI003CC89C05